MKTLATVFIDDQTEMEVKAPTAPGRSTVLQFDKCDLMLLCTDDDLARLATVLAEYLEGRAKCAG